MTWLETLGAHLEEFEGLRLRAYDDLHPLRKISEGSPVAGTLTIGYGHTGADVYPGQVIIMADALDLLKADVEIFSAGVDRCVDVLLNDNERAALVSFAFNVGLGNFKRSTLLRKLNQGDRAGAAREFPKWRKSKGKVLRGLVRRRDAERLLFLKPVCEC